MRDLGRAYAEGQCAERTVGARVRVTAYDGLAGLRRAELGPNDVDDSAIRARKVFELDTEVTAVLHDLPNLARRGRLADHVELAQ
jgi:hypothetical protein